MVITDREMASRSAFGTARSALEGAKVIALLVGGILLLAR